MAIEKLKINYTTHIKSGQIHRWTQTDQTTDTTQKSGTQAFKILKTTNTICGENRESSQVQVSL
jgi:hypothetical protein